MFGPITPDGFAADIRAEAKRLAGHAALDLVSDGMEAEKAKRHALAVRAAFLAGADAAMRASHASAARMLAAASDARLQAPPRPAEEDAATAPETRVVLPLRAAPAAGGAA